MAACPLKIPGAGAGHLCQNPVHRQQLSPGSGPPSPPDQRRRRCHVVTADMKNTRRSDDLAVLGINAGTPKQEIKKAYRRLALQYHPDVCKGDHCALKFKQIQAAYEGAMMATSPSSPSELYGSYMSDADVAGDCFSEGLMGVNDDSWEDWEEWMGWEGAGTRNYTSHINVHI